MHSSCYGAETTKPCQEPFMEASSTPSLFSVPCHHVHYHHSQQPQITSRRPLHGFPTASRIDQRHHTEEEDMLGPSNLARHEELQSLPGVHHQLAPLLPPLANVKFRLGLCENRGCSTPPCYSMSNEPQVLHLSQQDYYSNLKEPCRPADIAVLNSEKSKCSEMVNNGGGGMFGELEAVCNLAKTVETSQPRSSSAATGENSPQLLMPLTASDNRNRDPGGPIPESSRSVSMKKAERRTKRTRDREKRKYKEEMISTSMFFEALLKQVMDHQDFVHRKFLEVIERMEKERIEREEEWRQQEAIKNEGEATKRARERALALSTEALIATYIQKITGEQSPCLTKELTKPGSPKTASTDRSMRETKVSKLSINID